jgi:hypothetical protein
MTLSGDRSTHDIIGYRLALIQERPNSISIHSSACINSAVYATKMYLRTIHPTPNPAKQTHELFASSQLKHTTTSSHPASTEYPQPGVVCYARIPFRWVTPAPCALRSPLSDSTPCAALAVSLISSFSVFSSFSLSSVSSSLGSYSLRSSSASLYTMKR